MINLPFCVSSSFPHRGSTERELEALKQRLIRSALAEVRDLSLARELRWAAHEAVSLAWCTDYPCLVLPGLMDEKISMALKRRQRQAQLNPHP